MSHLAIAPPRRPLRPSAAVLAVTAVLLAATAAVAVLTAVVPGLAGLSRELLPARLDGTGVDHTRGQVLALLAHNGAIVAALLAAAALRTHAGRIGRSVCDALGVSIVARSVLLVGFVLGGQGAELVPFLVHLPFEWAAIAVGVVAWLRSLRSPLAAGELSRFAAAAVGALLAAAVLETYATPR